MPKMKKEKKTFRKIDSVHVQSLPFERINGIFYVVSRRRKKKEMLRYTRKQRCAIFDRCFLLRTFLFSFLFDEKTIPYRECVAAKSVAFMNHRGRRIRLESIDYNYRRLSGGGNVSLTLFLFQQIRTPAFSRGCFLSFSSAHLSIYRPRRK